MMKTQILSMLRGSNAQPVSGQDICTKLGVSRTAVWKYMNQLKEEGYVIEAVQNKGYTIVSSPDILTEAEIASRLEVLEDNGVPYNHFVQRICSYDLIDSTNTEAKKLAENGAVNGTLVIAEQQDAGKGRRGRSWVSPKGSGIWMTYILRPEILPAKASMLTLVAALAVAAGIQKICEQNHAAVECRIKWPNDIVINGKKIVGILTEMSANPDAVNYVVIGIGINVHTNSFDASIAATASSIDRETGKYIQRSELVALVSCYLQEYYEIFLKTGDLTGLIDEYDQMLVNIGREVRIIDPGRERTGIARGIDTQGELLVEREDGTIETVFSGEVSVRGLYGYV